MRLQFKTKGKTQHTVLIVVICIVVGARLQLCKSSNAVLILLTIALVCTHK